MSAPKRRDADGRLARNAEGVPRVERGQDVHRVLEDLEEALCDERTGDPRLYQRSGELVIARGVMAEDAKRLKIAFAPESVVIAPLRSSSLLPRITEFVDYGFWGFDKKDGDDGSTSKTRVWKREIPSGTVLSALLSKVFWAHARSIRGIAATPVIHLDGSIVDHGYDPRSRYYVASNIELPAIPDAPTHEDAKLALAALAEPFAEFPFETESERYAPVALALTLLLRPVIEGNVPAFVQGAPQKNCGKSLATKAACLLATGHVPASNTWAKVEEEQEKVIGSAADAGADVLFFDNVQEGSVIGGAPLDKVLTCDGQNSFRVLGQSKLKTLPWLAVAAFTANRPRVGGDTDRRAVVSQLIRRDVPLTTYRHDDLLAYVRQERARLLAGAFTLVRAWIRAGSPRADIKRLDSFERWAWTVASMIAWAGGGDVRALVRDAEGTDTDAQEYGLLEGMYGFLVARGRNDTTVGEMVEDVFARTSGSTFDDLRAAMESVGGFEGKGEFRKFDARRFGKKLSAMNDLLQGGFRLKKTGQTHGKQRWTVVKVGRPTSERGGLGAVGAVDSYCSRVSQTESIGATSTNIRPPTPPNPPRGRSRGLLELPRRGGNGTRNRFVNSIPESSARSQRATRARTSRGAVSPATAPPAVLDQRPPGADLVVTSFSTPTEQAMAKTKFQDRTEVTMSAPVADLSDSGPSRLDEIATLLLEALAQAAAEANDAPHSDVAA